MLLRTTAYVTILFRGGKNDTAEIRILPCGHLDFESAVTAQNDEFKAIFSLLVFTLDKRKKKNLAKNPNTWYSPWYSQISSLNYFVAT